LQARDWVRVVFVSGMRSEGSAMRLAWAPSRPGMRMPARRPRSSGKSGLKTPPPRVLGWGRDRSVAERNFRHGPLRRDDLRASMGPRL